ncbi:sulfotransferase family protein [Cesiribacter sp. SM1]|uniref:sulfotransferase-like domain-containing protein n=1 Tax=Cesiribacter sp. SM1 TaxID=2861196 RepID=UPI001CD6714C|nr:sulfotransferase family protein [Cesiribacter sp. SM1]
MVRIHLISGPRNISTALMYSFAQRSDTTVVDEPFYAYYLAHTGIRHPGREEVLASMSAEPRQVIEEVIFGRYATEVVFFKNMAKHLLGLEASFCEKLHNVFLIRDPARLITSFAKVVPALNESEIGLKHAAELFKALKEKGNAPLVLNSDVVLQNPALVLGKLCAALGIAFDEGMLSWQPGPRPEDGSWAKYWYGNVHKSSGFQAPPSGASAVPEQYSALLEEVEPYFTYLNQFAITLE